MQLRELIERLQLEEPDLVIPHGFDAPHSYRGFYDQLAFEPNGGPMTIQELLDIIKPCVGQVFQGYKGGDFKMSEWTDVWLANWGHCGDMLSEGHLEALIDEAHRVPLGKAI
jgi:hypothetical protein